MAAAVPAGFIITLEHLIYGRGATQAEAFADLRRSIRAAGIRVIEHGADDQEDLGGPPPLRLAACRVWPATAALLADVDRHGGATEWKERGGVACTEGETE